ncbi:hypothetical protein E4T39_06232 [Aureobasidium subglaciale]|nr:hypothetical protein E4T39_06232 [Aureobasidium subglaciale]
MPPKRKGVVGYDSYATASEVETEAAKKTSRPTSPALRGSKRFNRAYGMGKAISDIETSGRQKKKKAKVPEASPTRRSTRSTSRARQPLPSTEAPPLPTPPSPPEAPSPPTPRTPKSTSRSQSLSRRGRRAPAMDSTKPAKRTRTVSPRKRLIADSPPPEDKMDPFPKKRPPMTVTDKPAVRNRYGEKVPPPVDIQQKMRQALNFLSDEGVENCQDFEQKLAALDEWLRREYPAMDGIIAAGEEDVERLCRRVEYMIWVHKQRIEEGADQWFSRHQFPHSTTFIKPISPRKKDGWRLNPDGSMINRPEHAKLQVMVQQDRERAEKQRAERAATTASASRSPSKQAVRSSSPSKQDKAAVSSKAPAAPARAKHGLPYPEVWHRKEAARFPYGETPYMERVYSDQIDADLARGKESREALQGGSLYPIKKMFNNVLAMWPGGKNKNGPSYDPLKLPDISDEYFEDMERKHGHLGWFPASARDKRKAADAALEAGKAPAKRTRSGANAA